MNLDAFMKAAEAMVTHGVMSFPDGTREAVLAFHQIKGWTSHSHGNWSDTSSLKIDRSIKKTLNSVFFIC